MSYYKRIRIKYFWFLIFIGFVVLSSCRKGDYEVEGGEEVITDNGGGTGTTTWYNNKKYILSGLVFVNDGQILTIQPGTVIRSQTGQGSAATALIVSRGGKIFANGTPEKPIIFTVEGDDLEGSVPLKTSGLWGGLIILGNARLNLSSNEAHIEGIPLSEPRGLYGGEDDTDNSGILRYVSIRHGGTNIGEGNEINGLTLGGVGKNTIIENVEIVSNADDGVEFFGGTVNCKNIIVAFCGDDAFDFDIGYRGYGQFWFAIQADDRGDKILEIGGGIDPVAGIPYSQPQIFNSTFIGRGISSASKVAEFNFNAAGIIANSIFLNQGNGISVEYVENSDDSYRQFQTGNLELPDNIFFNVADNSQNDIYNVFAPSGINVDTQNQIIREYFYQAGNRITDPGIDFTVNYCKPVPYGDIFGQQYSYPDSWFDEVNYKGAFYINNWASGWTCLSRSGFLLD